jgi:hypothetical protein
MQCVYIIFPRVYSDGLLTQRQSFKLEDHPLSTAVTTNANISAVTPYICRQFARLLMVM